MANVGKTPVFNFWRTKQNSSSLFSFARGFSFSVFFMFILSTKVAASVGGGEWWQGRKLWFSEAWTFHCISWQVGSQGAFSSDPAILLPLQFLLLGAARMSTASQWKSFPPPSVVWLGRVWGIALSEHLTYLKKLSRGGSKSDHFYAIWAKFLTYMNTTRDRT